MGYALGLVRGDARTTSRRHAAATTEAPWFRRFRCRILGHEHITAVAGAELTGPCKRCGSEPSPITSP